jgi:glycosyltransferase A (GT-A) superfamily protein (DUF2064 family)
MTSQPGTGYLPAADLAPSERTVAVLVDAPRPELLPRALAAAVGERHALRLWRVVQRRTLDNIARLGWTPIIWFRPIDALPEMRRWLGASVALEPRKQDALGSMVGDWAERAAGGSWLLVRPAGAGVTVELLLAADRALATGGIVFGATTQDDIYLIGGPGGCAEVVRSLPWGERDLAPTLRARLRDAGRAWAELPQLTELVTGEDARRLGLA